jgi:hypothetical protein
MFFVLNRVTKVDRQIFDPANEKHVTSLAEYLRTGNWGEIQFYPELPFVEVPISVLTKFARYQLNVIEESAEEKVVRYDKMNVIPA